MKLLVGSVVFLGFLIMAFFGGMAGSSTALLSLSCMGFALVGHPLLWVALYRIFTGAAGGRIMWVAGDGSKPVSPRTRHKSASLMEGL